MNKVDLDQDLSLLKECELVRYSLKENNLTLMVVADCEEDLEHDHSHEEEEEHDCCCEGLNGHLFLLHFHGVTNFKAEGEECDNYVLKEAQIGENVLLLSYDGFNLFEPDSMLRIAFSFAGYEVEDGGKIEGCGV